MFSCVLHGGGYAPYLQITADRSVHVLTTHLAHRGLAYGESPTQRLDLLFPDRQTNAVMQPLLVFIHGVNLGLNRRLVRPSKEYSA